MEVVFSSIPVSAQSHLDFPNLDDSTRHRTPSRLIHLYQIIIDSAGDIELNMSGAALFEESVPSVGVV